jgi:hypothetical protein
MGWISLYIYSYIAMGSMDKAFKIMMVKNTASKVCPLCVVVSRRTAISWERRWVFVKFWFVSLTDFVGGR